MNGGGLRRSLGCAHHLAWDPSPAPRWLPAAVYPASAGHRARAGREQRSGRAGVGRLLGVAPSRPHTRCSSENRCRQGLSCESRSAAGNQEPPPPPPPPCSQTLHPGEALAGGPRSDSRGFECVQEGQPKGAAAHKGPGYGWGRGPRLPRTSALMKCRLGSPRRPGAHLENANAIGKSRANRQNFY